ncbi:MAG: hypothetical protein ACQETV_06780 [Actinomycetota bacterium]
MEAPTIAGALQAVREDPDARFAALLAGVFAFALAFALGFVIGSTVADDAQEA